MPPARALVLITATIAALSTTPSSATAATTRTLPTPISSETLISSDRPSTATPHCVAHLAETGQASPIRCYSSFRTAISEATGGHVTNAPATPATAVRDSTFAAELSSPQTGPQATFVVGIDYDNADYKGESLTFSAAGQCDSDPDVDYGWPDLGAAWNDRITSFRAYNNCAEQLFEDTNYRGQLTGRLFESPNVGEAANDKASSVTFN